MSTVEQTICSADELLLMQDGDRFEISNGELVEREKGALSGWVGNRVASRLDQHAEAHSGWAFGDGMGYRSFAEDQERVRRPDASFIRAERLYEVPKVFLTLAPDLAVEVVSPNDLYYEVEAKVAEYKDGGVQMVWLINPVGRNVRVLRPGKSTVELSAADRLTGDGVIPGFDGLVNDFFPKASPKVVSTPKYKKVPSGGWDLLSFVSMSSRT